MVSTSTAIGGMERMVCGISRGLPDRGWTVRTVCPANASSARLVEWCREQGVDMEPAPAVLDLADPHTLGSTVALWEFVRQARSSIVNLHCGFQFISLKDVAAVRAAIAPRCVVTLHGAKQWDVAGERRRRLTRLAGYLAHALVANSNAVRNLLVDADVPSDKVHVIPNGVRLPERCSDPVNARVRLGLPPRAFVIASLARLVPEKGIADLIEAVARIVADGDEVLVVVGGDGPARPALEALARDRLGTRAVFLGTIAGDTADLYASADVFVLPSYEEGFGLVYVEAAAHGVPSIGTRVGGIPEAVTDGETGILVPPGDIAALENAIRLLRDNPSLRYTLGEAAHARANAEFSETTMADRYARLFEELM